MNNDDQNFQRNLMMLIPALKEILNTSLGAVFKSATHLVQKKVMMGGSLRELFVPCRLFLGLQVASRVVAVDFKQQDSQ